MMRGKGQSAPRHFLEIKDLPADTLNALLAQAARLKASRGEKTPFLEGAQLAMVFEKNSTRTRISFEVAMNELGGHALFLTRNDLQLGRGEPVSDTAKVMSRYVDAIMIRCLKHETLLEMAKHATVPVINGLTDRSHPCQIMADILTFEERKGSIKDRKVAWIGDGNNVANSWVQAAARFG
ncbi:MAG: ornithine carbamoyltransferase, partial [Alphaproteobacteria bacterium]|nr:ornithine carbamoyltransferase [Alphaproteobacteria bacterium]